MAALNFQLPVRSQWIKQRSSSWWEEIVNGTFTQFDWIENFRMSHKTFHYLCNELHSTIEKNDTAMRKVIPVEQRVALTLWLLDTNANYQTIGHLFGVSKSAVCLVTKEVRAAIVQVLLPKYIKVLSGEGMKEVVNGFKHKWGFPQCAGAIDGTHIYQSCHLKSIQPTIITVRGGTPSSCKVR